MVKCNRVLPFTDKFFIEYIEHFKERHFRRNILYLVCFKATPVLPVLLLPDLEGEVHCVMFHKYKCGNVKMCKCFYFASFLIPCLLVTIIFDSILIISSNLYLRFLVSG